ncbi:Coenzyme F420 hydrogenase/dehydrogenase, beta subunit C-terminal domain [Ensifer sp. IC4062]|nr:Coenzyme F420 hydrogenase/dehydrogenase, beta subunit C-terminal domain [Ensifer sp. IC4062]
MSSNERRTPRDATSLAPGQMDASGLCIGCGACMAQSDAGAMRLDCYGQFKPTTSRNPRGFAQLCPFSPDAWNEDDIARERFASVRHRDPYIGRYEAAYVGYVRERSFRINGSSGGMASWTAAALLEENLVDGVAHVVPRCEDSKPLFHYRISRTAEDIRAGAKSRYYPVELSGVIDEMRRRPGRYAVVGIPCFIKALHLLCRQDPLLRERLAFTLGLFCGHMKSARFVESIAWQLGERIEAVADIDFRLKDTRRPANWYTAHLVLKDGSTRSRDWWHLADGDWGAGFFQNAACNFCDDVVAETADISFGDAWVEPYASDGRGTNVVVVRSPQLRRLVDRARNEGRLELQEVDSAFVVRTQAAGFRQRREGLAFRLSLPRPGVTPKKRVAPQRTGYARRVAIYWLRSLVSAQSHRVFRLAKILNWPAVYIRWASTMLALYQGVTYSRGWIGKLVCRIWPETAGSGKPSSDDEPGA